MKRSSASSVGKRGLSGVLVALLVAVTFMSALVVVSAPAADAARGTCSGWSHPNLSQARQNFEQRCYRDFNPNSGADVCDWNPDFEWFICSGPKSFYCTGTGFQANIQTAKQVYENDCNEQWRSSSGYHYCVWYGGSANGWQCHNNAY